MNSRPKNQILPNPVVSDHKLKKISQFNSTQPVVSNKSSTNNHRISEQKGYKKAISSQKEPQSSFSHHSHHKDEEISHRGEDRINERSNSMRSSRLSQRSPYEQTARTVKRPKTKQRSTISHDSDMKNT